MKCSGHVGGSHANALKELKSTWCWLHYQVPAWFPWCLAQLYVCNCKGRRHSLTCVCIRDGFIESSKRNLFCAITQCGNDASKFAQRMMDLGKYHARGIHKWEDGECDFHPLRVCSCGNCSDDEDFKCNGKEYQSKHPLTCPLHSLVYEIECANRAKHADEIIDLDLGRGHSNACEATFSVFKKFGLKMWHYKDCIIKRPLI